GVALYSEPRNCQRLLNGEIGDNLIYKYRVIAGFFVWPEVCRMAMDSTRELLIDRGIQREMPGFDLLWDDFHRYVERKHTHGATRETLLAPTVAVLRHDIPAWLATGLPRESDGSGAPPLARCRSQKASMCDVSFSPSGTWRIFDRPFRRG